MIKVKLEFRDCSLSGRNNGQLCVLEELCTLGSSTLGACFEH